MERPPCQTCRARHFECDKSQPSCRRCVEGGRRCVPAFNVRFKKRNSASPTSENKERKTRSASQRSNQAQVSAPTTFSFIDETPTRVCDLASTPSRKDNSSKRRDSHIISGSGTDNDPASHPGERHTYVERAMQPPSIPGLLSGSSTWLQAPHSYGDDSVPYEHGSPDQMNSLFMKPTSRPIIDRQGADLLHYFRRHIGPVYVRTKHYFILPMLPETDQQQFEVTDFDFTTESLRLAPICPVLLYSLLAVARIHQSRVEADQGLSLALAEEANSYHERCVSLLLPMLADTVCITDGAFLACSTILRFFEELSAPINGSDDSRHLLGGYASVEECQKQNLEWFGLRRAALWVHQRQDTYNALLNQRIPKVDFDRLGIERDPSPADDHIWAKRAACLKAEVLQFCFGTEATSHERFREIQAKLNDWDRLKPESFRPVYYEERDVSEARYFPCISLLGECCVFGLTYYYFSMLVMAVYDPTIPRLGPRYLERQKQAHVGEHVLIENEPGADVFQDQVQNFLRVLCGLGCSNPIAPARLAICLALSQFGARVSDPGEQGAVVNYLQLVEREHVWPTSDIVKSLRDQWATNGMD